MKFINSHTGQNLKPKFYVFFPLIALISCAGAIPYGVNENTTGIACFKCNLDTNEVDSVVQLHAIPDTIKNYRKWKNEKEIIESKPFKTKVLFLNSESPILIGVDFSTHCIRYLFNPTLSNEILIGGRAELNSYNVDSINTILESRFNK